MSEPTNLPAYVTADYLHTLRLRSGLGTGDPGDRCSGQEVRAWLDLDPSNDSCPPCVSLVCSTCAMRSRPREHHRSTDAVHL